MRRVVVVAAVLLVAISSIVIGRTNYRLAYYLTGWGTEPQGRSTNMSWHPQLTPLIGPYVSNDPDIAEEHIRIAIAHGVNGFVVPSSRPAAGWGWEVFFEEGLLQAENLDAIRFCMLFNNEPWWDNPDLGGITRERLTTETISYFAEHYFPREQYLQVNGSPVVVLYHAFIFRDRFGLSALQRLVSDIREASRKHGFDVYLIGDMMNTGRSDAGVDLFDAICSYAMPEAGTGWSHPDGRPTVKASYSSMMSSYCDLNRHYDELTLLQGVGFVPTAITGFSNVNMVAQGADNWYVERTNPSPELYVEMLECLSAYDREPGLVILGAWNEIHEGWVLEPTVEDGSGYLEAVRDVFGEGLSQMPYSVSLFEEETEVAQTDRDTSVRDDTAPKSEPESLSDLCQRIPLAAIDWIASINADENPDTPANHANIIQGTDEQGDYYGMEWNSSEFTDLTLIGIDRVVRKGIESISLTLAASEPMSVDVVISVSGEYCGDTWRFAMTDQPLQVGLAPLVFEMPYSVFTKNPFGDCVEPLTEEALEHVYSIILLPAPSNGELRVYDVALCGADIEPTAAAPTSEEPEQADATATVAEPDNSIPAFVVDSDVTRDSVVQIGDGPQELSTDIKFYPNTRRAKPGDTIYWTLEIGEDSGLEPPFTVIPEMNNDMKREPSIQIVGWSSTFAYTYESPNPYRPYVTLIDRTGARYAVYSMNICEVASLIEKRQGEPIKLPTPSDPSGDVVKVSGVRPLYSNRNPLH